MTPQRWSRMKEVFGAALEKPDDERSAFLDSACNGDADLRAEVERLLAESDADSLHSPANEFLNANRELAFSGHVIMVPIGVLPPDPEPARPEQLNDENPR
jgi:hypothetical protein